MKTLGAVVDNHSAKVFKSVCPPATNGDQKLAPPRITWPSTLSQALPGAGGVFHGHLASPLLPALDPKLLPSRSGLTLRLMMVPAFRVSVVMPCSATAAAPAISTP